MGKAGGEMQQRMRRTLMALAWGAGAVGLIWLTARFLLPWAAPFLLAYAVAALLEIPLRFLLRHGWRRAPAAGLLTITVLALIGWAAVRLSWRGITAVTGFAKQAPALMAGVGQGLARLQERAMVYISAAPEGVAQYMRSALEALGERLYDLPVLLSQWALDALTAMAQASPDILLFLVTAGIGTYFISASYPQTTAFLLAQLPEDFRSRLAGLGRDMKGSFGGFLRAQAILMLMTFFQLLLAFWLLEVKSPAAVAAVTALIDALPVFGTGIVLVPWAGYCLLLGSTRRGLGLLICWVLVNLVRNCAQAKLMGDQIGLNPLASLLAVYVGWRVWGVWGMLSFPILLVTLQQLNDKGVIRLWKRL